LSFFWIQHQIGLFVFLLVILVITLSNIFILRKLGKYPMPEHFPGVSVLVPARNEENNIGQCVRSLLNQDYPDFEVLVLDDNSTDGTWEVISEIASEDERLNIIKGKKLPDGWFGKHWACHQLAQAAGGELFLFTDADTRHHPLALRDAVAALIARKADLLTAFPHEEVISWGERLTIPIFPWFIIAFLPLFLAYRLRNPSLSATVGQFMLLRRQAYEQIGGYVAIRQEAVDDVALGRRIKAKGLKWRMINGGKHIQCRMYHSFREGYRGFTKNLFAGFGYRILKFVLVWLWLGIAFLEPIIVLAIGLTGLMSLSSLSVVLAAASAVTSLLIWGASHWCFGFPLYLAFLYPVSIIVALAIAAGSMFFALTGRADWRGRVFARPDVKWW
jgi:chlorobactene glucosyltransferase